MSLSDDEYRQAYASMEQALNDSDLSWIATQVAEDIRFGKMTTRRVSAQQDFPEDLAIPALSDTRRRRVQIPATREYTPREKLEILCMAIEQAVVAPTDMQTVIRTRLSRTDSEWTDLRLVRTDAGERPALEITRTADEQNRANVEELRRLLTILRETL